MAAKKVRLSPSGKVVVVDDTTGQGVTSVRWVDPATPLDPSVQDGSAIAPYSTLTAALVSLQAQAAGSETPTVLGTIICSDGDYGGEELSWAPTGDADQRLELLGFGGAFNFSIELAGDVNGFLSLEGLGRSSADTIPLTAPGVVAHDLKIRNCFMGALSCASVQISQLEYTKVYGAISADRTLEVSNAEIFSTLTVESGNITADNTRFLDAVTCNGGGDIVLRDVVFFGFVSAGEGGTHSARDTEYRAGLSYAGAALEATDCLFTGDEGAQFIGGDATIQGGRCDLVLQSAGDINLYDVVFAGAGEQPANVSCQNAVVNGCVLNDLAVVGELQIDTTSYQQAVNGNAVTFGTLVFTDAPLSITLEVVVPAVAADAVGYVDTSLVGTALEGKLAVGDPVVVNPQSDLVAAGAGGGFINARISGVDTLRCAFNGALAGGAANFTVARVR